MGPAIGGHLAIFAHIKPQIKMGHVKSFLPIQNFVV